MIDRYAMFVDTNYPDDAAKMAKTPSGEWVKVTEAHKHIDFLVTALINLKSCNIKLTTPSQLNDYVNKVLEGYK